MKQLNNLVLLLLLLPLIAIAQDQEYIITKANDTIYGKVIRGTKMFNPSKVFFKIKDENGKKSVIEPSEVKLIRSLNGVDGDCIIKPIYDEWFIKEIISGRITVYQRVDGTSFFVSKDNSRIMATDIGWFFAGGKAHAQIRPLLIDNPVILREFDTLKGTEYNIKYIIEKYNKAEK